MSRRDTSLTERRQCWLLANRTTLVLVGCCWLGMIAWELARGRTPGFLLAMVPVFALVRVGAYLYYLGDTRRPRSG